MGYLYVIQRLLKDGTVELRQIKAGRLTIENGDLIFWNEFDQHVIIAAVAADHWVAVNPQMFDEYDNA